ncbi:MAG TPA: hypothetical protein DCS05_00420, partial [Nitrospiraceae bacterium]|nr:hypothetical protein [Nitrospiraceae bacterium]
MNIRLEQVATIPEIFSEVQGIKVIIGAIQNQIATTDQQLQVLANDKAALEVILEEKQALLVAAVQRIDSTLAELYHAAQVPTARRTKKAESAVPTEKHPCPTCGDIFYNKIDLVKHARTSHGVSLEDTASTCTRESICGNAEDCNNGEPCDDEQPQDLSVALAAAREGRSKALAKEAGPVTCWNRSCAWSDLAQADHCDADDQFRQGRPVAECKCFVTGAGPIDGQDAAACFNTNCASNDPELPTCCEAWGEVWECPDVVTAGWGAAKEVEVLSGNDDAVPTDAEILSQYEPAEAIQPRGEFRTADLPKGKKKQAAMLEERRKDVANLVARRQDLFRRGSAAISEYDKNIGYDLNYNLKLNATQLSYALSQLNGLEQLLNPKEPINETATQETGPEIVEAEQCGAADAAPVAEQVAYAPLDEPLGDCELCHGFGVIDGELYGEFALIPCTCEAGKKVAGNPQSTTPKCCEDCSIEDPDCASCHLPDMETPFEAEDTNPS